MRFVAWTGRAAYGESQITSGRLQVPALQKDFRISQIIRALRFTFFAASANALKELDVLLYNFRRPPCDKRTKETVLCLSNVCRGWNCAFVGLFIGSAQQLGFFQHRLKHSLIQSGG